MRAHAQCDCAQGTCGRSFGCEWRLSAHGCGPGLSARLVPVHLCRVVTAPPVLWVSRTLGDRAHAGRTGPALCWSETGGLSRPRVWSQGTSALAVAQVAPRCPSRISPQTRLRRCAQHLPPGLTPRPLVLPWPGGLCGMATGDHGGALGLLSAVGVLTAQGPVSPWPPWPRPPQSVQPREAEPPVPSLCPGTSLVPWTWHSGGPDCGGLPPVGSRGHTWVHMQQLPTGSTSGTQRQPGT